MAEERILVGVVGAPHGVRGEVRLKSYTSDPMALAGYAALWAGAGGRKLVLSAARLLKDDMLVGRFADIDTRDAAQALTNTPLFVARADLPPPDEDEFYHADLIGLTAVGEDGATVGTVTALPNYGAGDLLEVAPPAGDTFLVPFTRAFVPTIDLPGRRVVLADAALPPDDVADTSSDRG
jgi:16S rRNA processing protein RimM